MVYDFYYVEYNIRLFELLIIQWFCNVDNKITVRIDVVSIILKIVDHLYGLDTWNVNGYVVMFILVSSMRLLLQTMRGLY